MGRETTDQSPTQTGRIKKPIQAQRTGFKVAVRLVDLNFNLDGLSASLIIGVIKFHEKRLYDRIDLHGLDLNSI